MATKRKNDGESTARERKRQKISDARSIPVQSARNGVSSGTATSLPGSIDVEKFAEARAFEINAMQNAIKAAGSSSTHRVWQLLPRHLRRRAASHDVRRVPLRMRDKARAEMDPVRKKTNRRLPKLGRYKRLSKTQIFLKRQINKRWLETHIWHAKRMHMEDMWGYRLAIKPTEKAFRPSHRASMHGSIIHDASYVSLIELRGPEDIIKTILESCCNPQGAGPGSKRFTTGTRVLETQLYMPSSYPFDLVAPITIMWRPTCFLHVEVDESEASEADESHKVSETKRRKRTKKKQSVPAGQIDGDTRIVWIRCHPSVFSDVYSILQSCASTTLEAARAAGKEVELEIADLRNQVNAFDIIGPKSSQVLKGALSPIGQDQRSEFQKFWNSLTNLQTSASIANGMVVGFKVHDPRLKFPPKNTKVTVPDPTLLPAFQSVPTPILAQSEIWSEKVRAQLKNPRFKKKDLDERRSKNQIPGTRLRPIRKDDRVPGLLIQRTLAGSDSDHHGLHGWTLIVPAGWGMPFFSSLIYTGTRVGGQRECQTQAFEAATAYFPRDYPTTPEYERYAAKKQEEEKAQWKRKPPAKRNNYRKMGIRSPWRADWEVVLGFELPAADEADNEEDLVDAERDSPMPTNSPSRAWLLQGSEARAIVDRLTQWSDPSALLLEEINKLRNKRNIAPIPPAEREAIISAALVNVKVTLCGKGAPGDLAAIYALSDATVYALNTALKTKPYEAVMNGDDDEVPEQYKILTIIPPSEQIIGYVTSGNFSLSRGQGYAIACVALKHLLLLYDQADRLHHPKKLLVNVRDRDGHRCRAAYISLL